MNHALASRLVLLLLLSLIAMAGQPVLAAQPATPIALLACEGAWHDDPAAKQRVLMADCETTVPIRIPDGWEVSGEGHTVRVVDPAGGRFRGGVLEAHGGQVSVRRLTIDGSGLTPGCSHDAIVAGVLYEQTVGTIDDITIVAIGRGVGERCGYGVIIGGPVPSAVRLTNTTIRAPGDAGVVLTGGRGELTGVTVEDAGKTGIIVCCAGGEGTLRNLTIVRPAEVGVSIEDGGTATLTDAVVREPGTVGVVALAGSTLQARGNHLDGGQAGIVISDATTHATLDGNTITGQAKDGIYIQKGAAATVANNALQAIAGNGITVTDAPGAGTIRGNTLREIAHDGIAIDRGAVDAVTGNVITDAGNIGIVAAANATVTSMANNQVSGGRVGIRLADVGTRAQIAGNSVHGQSEAGIWVLNGAVAETTNNTLVGPGTASTEAAFGPAGIHYASGASGAIRGNRVSNYRSDHPGSMACGIAIDRDAGAVERGDNTFPPPGNTSDLCQGAPPEFWQPGRATVVATPVP
jgi:hypothetical protein